MKKRGKSRRGYVPGDAFGNWMRSYWGVPTFDPRNPPQPRPDWLRLFLIQMCFGAEAEVLMKKDCQQVNFYTAKELVELAGRTFNWRPNKADSEESKQRQIRNVCRELGVKLKGAPLGRPLQSSKIRKIS
jgi:hypothetical protein